MKHICKIGKVLLIVITLIPAFANFGAYMHIIIATIRHSYLYPNIELPQFLVYFCAWMMLPLLNIILYTYFCRDKFKKAVKRVICLVLIIVLILTNSLTLFTLTLFTSWFEYIGINSSTSDFTQYGKYDGFASKVLQVHEAAYFLPDASLLSSNSTYFYRATAYTSDHRSICNTLEVELNAVFSQARAYKDAEEAFLNHYNINKSDYISFDLQDFIEEMQTNSDNEYFFEIGNFLVYAKLDSEQQRIAYSIKYHAP